MNINEAKAQIEALLNEAEQQNLWGGSEDEEGALHPGDVDWDELRAKIAAVLDLLRANGIEVEVTP